MATLQETILADLEAIFSGGLAQDITHVNGATNETLRGIFNNPHTLGFPGMDGYIEISSAAPALLIQTAAAGNIGKASVFTVAGATYYLAEKQPDQNGVTLLVLSKDQSG